MYYNYNTTNNYETPHPKVNKASQHSPDETGGGASAVGRTGGRHTHRVCKHKDVVFRCVGSDTEGRDPAIRK